MAWVMMSDIVEENGLTVKENNLNKGYKYKINAFVELETGARVFVARHSRDCDKSLLYGFKLDKEEENINNFICGYSEDYILREVGDNNE